MTKRSKRVLDPDYLRIGGLIRGGTTLYASAIKWIDPDPGHDERAGEPLAVATRESSATCSFAKKSPFEILPPIGTSVLTGIRHVPLAISHRRLYWCA